MSSYRDDGTPARSRVALVTGASTGLGDAIAAALLANGYRVVGTSRRAGTSSSPTPFPLLSLDVRSDASLRALVDQVSAMAGRLDVLVNNAAIRLLGAAEETSIEEAKDVFETNFFGVLRVTSAFLPMLRASRGRIVNVSSLAGLNALPFGAVYSASKWALEGYSEALRHELEPLGVGVSVVEPGAIRSTVRPPPRRPEAQLDAYAESRESAIARVREGDATGIDVREVAQCVVNIVEARSPALRYAVGNDARWLPWLKLLPWKWYERGVRRRYRLDGPREK